MNIQDLPRLDRPRERLLRYGPEPLSTIELIAILLNSGSQKKNVLDLATDLLEQFQSLEKIAEASFEELSAVQGIGPAKALQLQAAFSLAKRFEKREDALLVFENPAAIANLIRSELPKTQEAVMILLLDVKRNIFHREIIALGTLTEVLLHPREVYHLAIRRKAYSIVLAHNHPSGDPSPSLQDTELTQSLAAAGRTLGIELLDHLIIGASRHFSFRECFLLGS